VVEACRNQHLTQLDLVLRRQLLELWNLDLTAVLAFGEKLLASLNERALLRHNPTSFRKRKKERVNKLLTPS